MPLPEKKQNGISMIGARENETGVAETGKTKAVSEPVID